MAFKRKNVLEYANCIMMIKKYRAWENGNRKNELDLKFRDYRERRGWRETYSIHTLHIVV